MIHESQLTTIGHLVKPHGINGEINMSIEYEIDILSLKCFVLNMDGIYVPFFIEACRSKGVDARLITVDGITNEIQAADLCGKTVYALTDDLDFDSDEDQAGFYATDLIGYQILDGNVNIGEIIDIEDSTENALFVVKSGDNVVYIPIADEMIEDIISETNTIVMNLPEGILDL